MIKKLQKNKNIILSAILLCSIFGLFFGVQPVLAEDTKANPVMVGIVTVIGWIAFLLSYVIGYIATVAIDVLIWVARFNKIINVEAVTQGWIIVRDLCNMFFILILLVVAFATILRIESYQWKKILPKLLIMAVLINFSKTICGLIIDFSQVIMLTFVNGFAETGTARFVDMFQMQKYGSLTGVKDASFSGGSAMAVAAGIIMGVFAMMVSVIVILVILAVLVMRIIMLWVYTILSPIAFLAAAFPAGQKYSSQWWGEFSKNVIVGPLLAFFIWLALLTASTSSGELTTSAGKALNVSGGSTITVEGETTSPNALFSTTNFQSYVITLALLIGGLMVTQQMGGMAASIAGKGMAAVQKGGSIIGKGTKELGSFGIDKASQATKGAVDFNLVRSWGRLKDQFADNKAARAGDIEAKLTEKAKAGGRMAMLTHGGLAWQNLKSWDGIKGFAMGTGRNKYNDRAKKLEDERMGVWTSEDKYQAQGKLGILRNQEKDITSQIGKYKLKGSLTPEQQKELNGLQDSREDIRAQTRGLEKELRTKIVNDKRVEELDGTKNEKGEIEKNRDLALKYKVKGADIADADAKAKLIAAQEKKLTHIDNSDRLGEILKDALKEGNQGLIAAVARKMTKQGDYNDLAKIMKVGTGTKGMQDLAKKFQDQGGMSVQSSRGLIAEMGLMCKSLNQFGGYAAMNMDKGGNWQEATEDEAQTAQLAEMMKMEPQKFALSVNRLGLGHYDDPSGNGEQNEKTWHLSKAATMYIKLNKEALGEQYEKRGMQNAIEHLASRKQQLINNGIDSNHPVIKVIDKRSHKGATNAAEQIKSAKT